MGQIIELLSSNWIITGIATLITMVLAKKLFINLPRFVKKLKTANILIDRGQDVLSSVVDALTDNPDTPIDEGRELTASEIQNIINKIMALKLSIKAARIKKEV